MVEKLLLNPRVLSTLAGVALLTACGHGAVPDVTAQQPAIQRSQLGAQASQATRKQNRSNRKNTSSSTSTCDISSCSGWTSTSTSDADAGTWVSTSTCATGGDIAEIDSSGTVAADGSQTFTETYDMRDGSKVVWTGTESATGALSESDTLGNTITGQQTYNAADGSTSYQTTSVYVNDGTYVDNGVMQASGASAGTLNYTPNAANTVSVAWVDSYTGGADGSRTDNYQESGSGWSASSTIASKPDGTYTDAFQEAIQSPQQSYSGNYAFNADGSGTGGYTGTFDDGSVLTVSDVDNADCTAVESWKYDGPPPSASLEQIGSITYASDGSGSGSETNYLADGSTQTCAVTVASDGSYTLGACH